MAHGEGVRKHNGSAYKEKPVENVLPKNELFGQKKGRFVDIKEQTTPCIFFYPIAVGMKKMVHVPELLKMDISLTLGLVAVVKGGHGPPPVFFSPWAWEPGQRTMRLWRGHFLSASHCGGSGYEHLQRASCI
jgi:hypothetical protein